LKLDGDKIEDIRFEGNGCAISKSSASIMTTLVKGKSFSKVNEIFDEFHTIITDGCDDHEPSDMNLEVFCGVKEYPGRVKCAALAWHTLVDAMNKD
jgi:nitrogen fixation NifU-like protein